MNTLRPGFYWVHMPNGTMWTIAQMLDIDRWFIPGNPHAYGLASFNAIGKRIKEPK